jgi:hypothetical protein
MQGWIKLHRSLIKKEYFRNPNKLSLWILLLLKAAHEPRIERFGGKNIVCKPGQFTTGRRQLAQELGISESMTNRLLNEFEKNEQQIEQQTCSTNRLITIVNWKKYQKVNNELNSENQKSEQQSEHTIRSSKNLNTVLVRNEKNKNEKINGNNSQGDSLYAKRYGNGRPSDYL